MREAGEEGSGGGVKVEERAGAGDGTGDSEGGGEGNEMFAGEVRGAGRVESGQSGERVDVCWEDQDVP